MSRSGYDDYDGAVGEARANHRSPAVRIENYAEQLSPEALNALVSEIREHINNPPHPWTDRWLYHDGSHTELIKVMGGRIFLWSDEEPHSGVVIAACRFGPMVTANG